MAQGAKPGEGGQLPGDKVDDWIGATTSLDSGRRSYLATATPRYLLNRGFGSTNLRSEKC